jgi:hypothetical protein
MISCTVDRSRALGFKVSQGSGDESGFSAVSMIWSIVGGICTAPWGRLKLISVLYYRGNITSDVKCCKSIVLWSIEDTRWLELLKETH